VDIFNVIAGLVSIVGTIFAYSAWRQAQQVNKTLEQEKERQNKNVKVMLKDPTHHIVLPFDLRRRETTRAEILGRIGMIPLMPLPDGKPRPRFEILYTNTESFLRKMYEIIDGKDDAEFEITCESGELDQFNLAKFQHLLRPN